MSREAWVHRYERDAIEEHDRQLLRRYTAHLHETGALSVPPEDLEAAVSRFVDSGGEAGQHGDRVGRDGAGYGDVRDGPGNA